MNPPATKNLNRAVMVTMGCFIGSSEAVLLSVSRSLVRASPSSLDRTATSLCNPSISRADSAVPIKFSTRPIAPPSGNPQLMTKYCSPAFHFVPGAAAFHSARRFPWSRIAGRKASRHMATPKTFSIMAANLTAIGMATLLFLQDAFVTAAEDSSSNVSADFHGSLSSGLVRDSSQFCITGDL